MRRMERRSQGAGIGQGMVRKKLIVGLALRQARRLRLLGLRVLMKVANDGPVELAAQLVPERRPSQGALEQGGVHGVVVGDLDALAGLGGQFLKPGCRTFPEGVLPDDGFRKATKQRQHLLRREAAGTSLQLCAHAALEVDLKVELGATVCNQGEAQQLRVNQLSEFRVEEDSHV